MAPRARRRKLLLVSISAALAMTGAAYLKARRRRDLCELVGELAGVVAQPFVEQGVDPPLHRVCFSREVFVAYRYALVQPLLDQCGISPPYLPGFQVVAQRGVSLSLLGASSCPGCPVHPRIIRAGALADNGGSAHSTHSGE
jgi:hypothetical protein